MTHQQLRVVKGDIQDPESVALATGGQDTVCCSIGVKVPWIRVTLFSDGTRNLLQAMNKTGIRRLICVTGIGAGDSRGHDWRHCRPDFPCRRGPLHAART